MKLVYMDFRESRFCQWVLPEAGRKARYEDEVNGIEIEEGKSEEDKQQEKEKLKADFDNDEKADENELDCSPIRAAPDSALADCQCIDPA